MSTCIYIEVLIENMSCCERKRLVFNIALFLLSW